MKRTNLIREIEASGCLLISRRGCRFKGLPEGYPTS
jgi:hypothetical protein